MSRVNVNELTFPNTKTEWTVYLGTVVDPAKQIRQLYESITVEEVVNVDGDENGRLHYLLKPTHPDDISDERDDPGRQDDRLGTADTFLLAPVILDRIKNDPYSSNELKSRYLDGDNLNWTNFLADILETGGVTVPYHPYGIEGEDSNLVITLEKRIKGNEESDLLNHSPHVTTETGIKETEMVAGKEVVTKPAVEEYVLTVRYNPDYKHVLPKGQGGDNAYNFHTGTYGSTYQGHSAGRETSSNTHVINVYSVPLDVYKTNENDGPLQGATFKLYVEDAENGVSVPGLHEPAQEESGNTGNDSSSGKYTEVASGTSGTDGIAHLLGEDDTPFGLVKGKTYYLIEYEAPSNYTKVNTVWAVEVQTEIGKFTSLDGTTIYSRAGTTSGGTGVTDNMYPFNWDQGARIVLNGKQPADVIVKGEEEGQTDTITNGSFVSYSEVISFRHTVQNLGGDIDITVQKTWDDEDDPNRPSSVTVQLYRVGEKDHQWSAGKVIPCTCTAAGVEEYICSVCGKKDTHAINAAGHISGTAHRENETEATCATPGGYDTVVRCKVCNAVITSEHTTIAALGHIWGEWKVTTPAQPGVAGEETRVCQRDPSHIETRPIAPLPNETTITYTTYRDWYGRGWHEDDVTTSTRYQIGSRIRLSWSSRNSYNVTLYINGTERNPRYVTYNYENGYALTGETQQVTRTSTGSYYNRTYNYEVTVTVTDGMTLFLKSDTWDYYPPNNITITPVRSVQNSASRLSTMRSKETLLSSLPALEERTSLKDKTELLRGDSDIKTAASAAMTAEELQTFLSNLKSKEEATCSETEGSTHIYKEWVGEYTIEGDDWTRNIPDLPKYNEYGKEYAYYVLETVPSTGYEITYQGQDSGLNSTNGSVEIINKLSKGALLITKSVQYNHQSATSNDEKMLLNGTYQFTVKRDGIEIAGSPFSITVSNGVSNSVLIPDLEAGDYTVAETNSGDLTLDSSSGGSSVLNNIVTVTVTAGKTTEEMLLDTAKASFTNNYTEYGIEILKVDVENSRTKLGGARFNLYAAEDVDTSTWAEPDTNRRLNSSDIVSSSNQATLGEAHLGKLTPGTYYLFETKAPDGYNSLESPIQIIVSDGHISWTQGTHQETRDSSRSGDIVGNTAAFNVTNTAGFELPATGGPGTTLLYLLGFMLTGFAGAGLVMRKRRRDAA